MGGGGGGAFGGEELGRAGGGEGHIRCLNELNMVTQKARSGFTFLNSSTQVVGRIDKQLGKFTMTSPMSVHFVLRV